MKTLKVLFVLCVGTAVLAQSNPVQRLRDVHKIYVNSLGTGEGSDVVRSKVVTRLVKSGRFEVVQSPEVADAVLVGASQVSKTSHYSANANGPYANASGGTRYHATAGVQLVSKEQKILWADDTTNGAFSRSVSSSLADRIVKDLIKAAGKDEQ